jgi:hypothetical protein
MRRLTGLICATTIAVAVGAIPPTTAATSTGGEAAQTTPSCSLTVERLRTPSGRLARKTVKIGARCNYLVTNLGLRTSLAIRKVRRAAALEGATVGDYLTCSRRFPTRFAPRVRRVNPVALAGCSGMTGFNTRSTITVAMRRSVCRPKRLRVRVHTFGGIDCRGSLNPCASIGYTSNVIRTISAC